MDSINTIKDTVYDKEELENFQLLMLAIERISHYNPSLLISQEEVDRRLGFTEKDLFDAEKIELE